MSFVMLVIKQHLHLEIAILKFNDDGKYWNFHLANFRNAAKNDSASSINVAENDWTDWQFSVSPALLYKIQHGIVDTGDILKPNDRPCSIAIYPLQRVFYPQNLSCTPKIEEGLYAAIHWGYKNQKMEQIYPQVQSAVKTLRHTRGEQHSTSQQLLQELLLPQDHPRQE